MALKDREGPRRTAWASTFARACQTRTWRSRDRSGGRKSRKPRLSPVAPTMDAHPNQSAEIKPRKPLLAKDSRLDLKLLLQTLQAVRDGDFTARLPGDWTGLAGKVADTFNEILVANGRVAQELKRVGQVVGKEGKTNQR